MIHARPETTFEAQADGFATGLAGTIGVRIIDTPAGTTITARTTTGITEAPAGSGLYSVLLTAPATAGDYSIVWDTGGGAPTWAREELHVTTDWALDPPDTLGLITPTPTYLNVEDFLADPSIPDSLDDDAAAWLIVGAEDFVDAYLGDRTIDTRTGRKVASDDTGVAAWQWAKLQQATLKLAVRFYKDPDLVKGRQWTTERVADVSLSGPTATAVLGEDVVNILDQSDLYEAVPNLW